MLWFKRDMFRQVVKDLVELWPVAVKDEEAAVLKRRSLTALRYFHFCYMLQNVLGVTFYNVTPIALYIYQLCRGTPAELGFIWAVLYPFDKTKPYIHEFVFAFECFSGVVSVWAQLGADLMFTAMASHISMLLRLLQVRIRHLGDRSGESRMTRSDDAAKYGGNIDCYDEIVSVIKVHQRLISYSKDLEDVFAMVNLVNVLLSSVNICCVVFNIVLLESWMDVSNKLFLGAALTQVGIICWYADEIYQASIGVANAVYESGWYKTNPRCRRAMLLLLQR
ncbi:7tm odorant receptor domain-containing protein [Phthorimaea operculella]|nr:7tm odorant receptor domain-containing protein [Phthorimaea operculella]